VWFPGIDKSVESMISNCLPCQACVRKTVREPLQMSPLSKGPWVDVSADICGPFPAGEYVLVALDAYSRYPEVEIVSTINTAAITLALERIFATHGIPEDIKTDNGALFQGKEFAEFSKE
jgi:transposase InsO family protein